MKKNIVTWMTIALMAFLCAGLAACGGDDDDTSGGGGYGGGTASGLNGSWVRDDPRFPGSTEHWTFNNGKFDGHYHYIVTSMNFDYLKGESGSYTVNSETHTINLSIEWTYETKDMTAGPEGELNYNDHSDSPITETMIYSISGNSLTLTDKDGDTFTYTRDTSK